MPLDVDTPGTPGWWMQQLWNDLRAERRRLDRLDRYRRGQPDLVIGSRRLHTAFYRFQQQSRSNFAELIVTAMTERMSLRSFQTAAVDDDNGDSAAYRIWSANHLDVGETDFYDDLGTFGVAYCAQGAPLEPGGEPVITIEDPRQMITRQHPLNPLKTIAAFKVFHDSVRRTDYAYLWLPGQMFVAQRSGAKARAGVVQSFAAQAFDLLPFGEQQPDGSVLWQDGPDGIDTLSPDDMGVGYTGPVSETYADGLLPVVRAGNRRGVGEFELHIDLLDRINQTVLNKMVIITLQAFKQRAIETSAEAGEDGGLPDEDEQGNLINYDEIFEADPGALWRLPIGAKIWESQEVNMQGILSSARDDILHLAAVSRTPFPMFSPDSANQSANGASLYREGLTFKVEDRCKIAGRAWAQVMANAFAIKGDTERSNAADITANWHPADRYSILEMAQADAQSTLPRAQKYARIYGMSPAEVKIALAQAQQDAFAAAALSQVAPRPALQVSSQRLGTGSGDGTDAGTASADITTG